ncbi:annexin Gh1-like [Rhododendron vialii]|uniref:annexin Gh1-like n=1 Tax=Rhododendron vialii TaxID=182163 RepID=UPI00265EB9A6|nr:annexin Gh1-like [Rhododendron vialii]
MESSMQASRKYELDCQYLNSCFLGNGEGNRQKLVETLTSRDSQELKLIHQTFRALYNQDLHHVLSTIRHNDELANAVYLRMSEPQERDAEIIREALFGRRVNVNTLVEVVSTRSSTELHSIKQAYRFRYNSEIEQDMAHTISATFKEILLTILKSSPKYGGRIDTSMAMCDAKTLYEAMETGNSVDWKTITSLLTQRNTPQIKSILSAYKELYGHEFSKFLKSNKCGKFGTEMRMVIQGIQFPGKFFAKQLRGALQSGGDGREILTRVVITRLEIDVREMSNVFAVKTGWSLGNFVRREFNSAGGDKGYDFAGEFLLGLLRHC